MPAKERFMRQMVRPAPALSVLCLVVPLALTGCPQVGGTTAGGALFNLPPIPVITADVDRGVAPLTVSFSSDRSTDDGLIVLRQWDFGDGATSQDIRPVHVFTSTGEFVVRLTLTDDLGATATRTLLITVTEAPVAIASVDRTSAEFAPAIFHFDASASFDPDGTIESYRWDFGDGSVELLSVVSHTYARPGSFRARLTVEDDNGITASTDLLISVGIRQPQIVLRVPGADLTNLVLSPGSPLWIQGVYEIEPGVPFMVRAGLDGDRDTCNAQAVVIDPNSLLTRAELIGHDGPVTGAAFSPDGQEVLTSSLDGTLRLYSALTGDLLTSFAGTGAVTAVDFAPDGARFAYGQSNGAVVLRDRTGAIVREFISHVGPVNDLEFSPSGEQLLSAGSDRRALLWNVSDGTILRDFPHDLAVNAVAFNRGDPGIVATGGADSLIKLWNVAGGSQIATLIGHTEPVNALAFSRDGMALLSGGDDNTARLWQGFAGFLVATFGGNTSEVVSVAFSPDAQQLLTGAANGFVRRYETVTAMELGTARPCLSPVSEVAFAADGSRAVATIAARNDIQLDTTPPSGNDLTITYPRSLSLRNVAARNGEDVPPGEYFLWAEIDTDRTDPVRTYASAAVHVVGEFPATISPAQVPPQVVLINDRADVIVDPNRARSVFDIGPLDRGDRLFLSLLSQPGAGEFYTSAQPFSLMVTDADQNIFAWYQEGPDPGPVVQLLGLLVTFVVPQDFVLFTPETKLVIGHSSPRHYVITDGGNSVRVRIQRGTDLFQPLQQRVWVNFEGAGNVSAGLAKGRTVPPLRADDFNEFFMPTKTWGDSETAVIQANVMATLRQAFAGYDVEFLGTNESPVPPALPYQVLHVGGRGPLLLDGRLLIGAADYIDPRNQTQSGSAIVFATEIGADLIGNPALAAPVTDEATLARAIGIVAAHQVGHLLGLRHTDDPGDIMQVGGDETGFDPTLPRVFTAALVSIAEQIDVLPPFGIPDTLPLGIQNAPLYLSEVVGTR
jgi:WD40 repeat protein